MRQYVEGYRPCLLCGATGEYRWIRRHAWTYPGETGVEVCPRCDGTGSETVRVVVEGLATVSPKHD